MIYWKGLRFGLLLQLAVGPVCLFVFSSATRYGTTTALAAVLGVALVDAAEMALAAAGAGRLLQKSEKVKRAAAITGAAVLAVFGFFMVTGALGGPLLPAVQLFSPNGGNLFWQAVLLTAANPLTIVFWGGVFTSELAQQKLTAGSLLRFCAGCICATLFFLSAVALLGGVLDTLLPAIITTILNALVGGVLVVLGAHRGIQAMRNKPIQ
ncbi:MAG: hypothetical protein PWQ08_277 [Clostridiales bacterium]|jgi:threonine/homoserine/homoserine lactone efflux protein|nr:LysE family transporter [Pygmaiobacter sp.]MDK2813022.1 hypothetical protein [Clostridiales bacterium]